VNKFNHSTSPLLFEISSTERKCKACGRTQPMDQFNRNPISREGRAWTCKSCMSSIEYRIKHRKYNKDYYDKRRSTEDGRRLLRNIWLQRDHDITVDQYDEILASQGGKCAICGTTDPGGRGNRYHVDHCHETGSIRGLLCHMCNKTLGNFGDNISGIMRVVKYLSGPYPIVRSR